MCGTAALCCRGSRFGDGKDFRRARTDCPIGAAGRECRVSHPGAEIVAASLGHHVALDRTGFVAHSTRQVPKAQPQPCAIQVLDYCAMDDRLELTNACILASPIAEILPGSVARADGSRRLN